MRILYFSFVELDIPIACRTHTLGVLKGFANQGCQVDALIPRPTKIFPQIPGVRFFYLWPWQFSPIGIVWVKLLCGLMMLWLCLKNRYDFIYVRELQLNPGPRLCSKAFKIPLYIEINDLLVPSLSNAGAHPGFVSLIARHQQMDCRQASGLIVPSVPMRQWLVDHYRLEPTKVHLVLNGADRPAEHPSTKREARGRLGIPQDCFCVGFVGNLYGRYDFDTLLDSLRACRTKIPPFYLLLIGDGSLKNDLQQKIIECGLEKKALFTGYIEHEMLGRYIPAMDVGMCLFDQVSLKLYGPVSTKPATYGIFKIPVIVSGTPLAGYPEALCQSLFWVPAEDSAALSDLFLGIYKNSEERKRKGKALHAFVCSEMTWDAVAGVITRIARHRNPYPVPAEHDCACHG